MLLYILRHAEAAPGFPDAQRALTPKGIRSIQRLAQWMKRTNIVPPSEIRHSPLLRAIQTTEVLYKQMDWTCPTRKVPLLEPCDDFRITADLLNKESQNLMIVGHQPHLSSLASYLLGQDPYKNFFKLKKSAIICLEKPDNTDISSPWTCRWFITPKSIKTL